MPRVHGPVNREIYDRFKDEKSLYSTVTSDDIQQDFNSDGIKTKDQRHINKIISVYGDFTGDELEEMTHQEEPWVAARKGFRSTERCETPIDEQLMAKYYAKRLKK